MYKGKEQFSRLGERFGLASIRKTQGKKLIWLHAASVGEILSAIPLIEQLNARLPGHQILITSGTITSAKITLNRLSGLAIHQFLPLDNYLCINMFLNHWQPDLALFLESEFWPCILTQTASRCQIISVNTRISERSFNKWQKYPNLARSIIDSFGLFLPQSLLDQRRLQALGVTNYSYLGNLKYSTSKQIVDQAILTSLHNMFRDRVVLLAASTHPGEEEVLASIFKILRPKIKNLLLILAPRHPVRSSEIKQLLTDTFGFNVATRSAQETLNAKTDVYLADTLGELNYFYSIAPISIVGGSFVPIGGHNPIEPAKCDCVIITGPNYANFKEIYDEFFSAEAAFCAQNEQDCATIIERLYSNPKMQKQYTKNALELVARKDQTLELVVDKILTYTKWK